MKFAPVMSEPFLSVTRGVTLLMAEAPLVHQHKAYREWFRARPANHRVILDNGAALAGLTRAIDFDDIMDAAALIDADEIVLPDVMYDAAQTLELARTYVQDVPPKKRFLVPQGNTIVGWVRCALQMLRRYNFEVLGVPKHLDQLPGGRLAALEQLKDKCPRLGTTAGMPAVHLLGIWSDPIEILYIARRLPWVRSVDSSLPCAYAQVDRSLAEWPQVGKLPFTYWTLEDFFEKAEHKVYRERIIGRYAKNLRVMTHLAAGRWDDG